MLWAVSERAWIFLLDLSFTIYLHRCHGHHHQQFTNNIIFLVQLATML